ncbi:hypothetical protein [Prescottella equi]|uniref:hypothetical protein n=1 Tax=Rhodococcus hoagii TaxID=43767 RepID=UPI0012FA7C5B|nr:hypothetical protein [Prescottella equi]
MTTPDHLRRTRRGRIAATLLAATAGIALAGGVGTASAETTVSYHARFCSDAKDGNTSAFQVNEGKPSDFLGYPFGEPPEDTWHGEWMSNVTFETWVGDVSTPYGKGMWCHTVVRADLGEGDWVRLSVWNPSGSTATRLTEVVEVNGLVFERPVSGGWAAVSERCCHAGFPTLPAPTIPTLVGPAFVDTTPVTLTGTVGTSLTRNFTATGTPAPAVTVVDPAKLPPGTTFTNDPVTGVPTLSGTPTTAGIFDFTLTAANGVGTPKTLDVTVTVALAPVIVEEPASGSLGSLRSIFGS